VGVVPDPALVQPQRDTRDPYDGAPADDQFNVAVHVVPVVQRQQVDASIDLDHHDAAIR